MTLMLGDRAFETSTTTGTGTINLAGPVSGFISFVAAVGSGNKVPYIMTQTNGSGVVTAWETGYGIVTSGSPDTLTRNPRRSSNANAAVSWGTGTRNVFLGAVADFTPFRDENMNFLEGWGVMTGTNAYSLTLPITPIGYSDGMLISAYIPNTNTAGPVTITVNGLASVFMKMNGADPGIGNFPAGQIMTGRYVNSLGWFELTSPRPSPVIPLGVPSGAVMPFAMSTIPTGWLECNGASLLRASYTDLFAAIGTTYGSVDGTHFTLPDLRGEFIRGWDHGKGTDSGRAIASSQSDAFQGHLHSAPGAGFGSFVNSTGQYAAGSFGQNYPNTGAPATDGTNGTPRTAQRPVLETLQ